MRQLLKSEIEKLASRKGVKRIAVENFLMTMHHGGIIEPLVRCNLDMDARAYRWNAATVKAISDGLKLAREGGHTSFVRRGAGLSSPESNETGRTR